MVMTDADFAVNAIQQQRNQEGGSLLLGSNRNCPTNIVRFAEPISYKTLRNEGTRPNISKHK